MLKDLPFYVGWTNYKAYQYLKLAKPIKTVSLKLFCCIIFLQRPSLWSPCQVPPQASSTTESCSQDYDQDSSFHHITPALQQLHSLFASTTKSCSSLSSTQ